MKFPKNRASLYIVVRRDDWDGDFGGTTSLLGGFADFDEAENYKGACAQEWLERVGRSDGIGFYIELTTFYG